MRRCWLGLAHLVVPVQHNFAFGANTMDEVVPTVSLSLSCCWRATIVAIIDMDALIDMRPPG